MNELSDQVDMTVQIVTAFLSNNTVSIGEVPGLITSTHAAICALGAAPEPAADPKPIPAVSVRASVKPNAIISMIDGKPYKMLRRHLRTHGYDENSYRAAYDLPANYPMVAPDYAAKRRQLAIDNGLGRKAH